MSRTSMTARRLMIVGGALIVGAGFAVSANSQTAGAPPAAPAPAAAAGGATAARAAIDNRKAVFTLIGDNFRPIGNVLKGSSPYDAAAAQKAIARLVFLSDFLPEAFPDISNVGEPETKAKPDIWTNRADFDKKLKDFQTHLVALQQVNDADKSASEAFKTAATAVGGDCKACHDAFKVK